MKFEFHVSLDLVGCEIKEIKEIPDDELDGIEDDVDALEATVEVEYMPDWVDNKVHYWAKLIKGE